jgi:hypothetical protein
MRSKKTGFFPDICVYKRTLSRMVRRYDRRYKFCGEKEGKKMIGKTVLGLVAVVALLLVIAAPVTAAEKTIQMNIPGCTA